MIPLPPSFIDRNNRSEIALRSIDPGWSFQYTYGICHFHDERIDLLINLSGSGSYAVRYVCQLLWDALRVGGLVLITVPDPWGLNDFA
jgi:hypothetical protein